MRILGALLVTLGLLAGPAGAEEVHGKIDVFSAPGVKLAWAIARGPDEARTFVVVRMRLAPGIGSVTVTGRDPFTKDQKVLEHLDPRLRGGDKRSGGDNRSGDDIVVRIPRASFSDFPRTEWAFSGAGKEPLTVFYLGVPDTTPEFAEAARLDAYLVERLDRLQPGR